MRQTFDEKTDRGYASRHLPRLRAAMKGMGFDGFIVPHEDEYQDESVPPHFDRLSWISGYTGSAGMAVVLTDRAAIFVDGRYTLQVRHQVDGDLFEYKELHYGGPSVWLAERTPKGARIGFDPKLHTPDAIAPLEAAIRRAGAELAPAEVNPVDLAWGDDRPPKPRGALRPHPLDYSGEPSAAKRARVGEAIAAAGADVAVVSAPASIAWLFNLRGSDHARTPIPLAQALLKADGSADLFVDQAKVGDDIPAWLGNAVRIRTEEDLGAALGALGESRVLVDPAQTSAWHFHQLERAGAAIVRAMDPCALPRALKNPTEVRGAQTAHIRDGAAMARFLRWVETEAQATLPDELEIVTALEAQREATGALEDLSFDAICGAGANGAIIHYRPTVRMARRTEPNSLLLVDSGGQYLDGTTDITRTLAIGEPTAEHRERFTLVLKGHIAMATVRFPKGTTGSQIDVIARLALWEKGLDYEHGTGHGVGSYLGVHEGPQRIAKQPNAIALAPGMIVSNEPGYYKPDAYGVRTESLQVVVEDPRPGDESPMLTFHVLTLVPIDRRLVDKALLTAKELAWLDAYHARVLKEVGPLLDGDDRAWLETACAPL